MKIGRWTYPIKRILYPKDEHWPKLKPGDLIRRFWGWGNPAEGNKQIYLNIFVHITGLYLMIAGKAVARLESNDGKLIAVGLRKRWAHPNEKRFAKKVGYKLEYHKKDE